MVGMVVKGGGQVKTTAVLCTYEIDISQISPRPHLLAFTFISLLCPAVYVRSLTPHSLLSLSMISSMRRMLRRG